MMKKMLLLLVFWGCTLSSAWALDMNTQQNSTFPSYQFQSTSSYTLVVGHTSYTADPYNPSQASGPARARKGDPWDDTDPSGLGVGEVDDPAPIGEPWVLLLMAVLYIFYTKRKKIQEKFAQFKKKQ